MFQVTAVGACHPSIHPSIEWLNDLVKPVKIKSKVCFAVSVLHVYVLSIGRFIYVMVLELTDDSWAWRELGMAQVKLVKSGPECIKINS